MTKFAILLRQAMYKRGMRQIDLANMIGVLQGKKVGAAVVCRWMSGKRVPDGASMACIIGIFGDCVSATEWVQALCDDKICGRRG